MSDLKPFEDLLREAIHKTFSQVELRDKIGWYLRCGSSAERWLQLELGYQLQQSLDERPNGQEYVVGYEQDRVDLLVYKNGADAAEKHAWMREPVVGLELKVHGNWYWIGQVAAGILADQEKVEGFSSGVREKESLPLIPKYALVIWMIAKLDNTSHDYKWLQKQIDDKEGFSEQEQLIEWNKNKGILGEQLCEATYNKINAKGFEYLKIVAFCHKNRAAAHFKI